MLMWFMKNVSILSAVLATALLSSQGAVAAGPRSAPAISVVTDLVQVHQISQSLSLVGKLEAEQSVIISPEVAGKVDVIAVKANQMATVQYLIEEGVSVDAGKENHNTPLREAVRWGHLEILKYLVSNKADLTSGRNVKLPIHEAVIYNQLNIYLF